MSSHDLEYHKSDMKLVGKTVKRTLLFIVSKKLQEIRGKVRPGLLPPYYADLPKSFDELCASEENILVISALSAEKQIAFILQNSQNILVKRARSN